MVSYNTIHSWKHVDGVDASKTGLEHPLFICIFEAAGQDFLHFISCAIFSFANAIFTTNKALLHTTSNQNVKVCSAYYAPPVF